jgi:hypothetical protein
MKALENDRQRLRRARKELRDLIGTVDHCCKAMDKAMSGPSTLDRGKRIAAITNALDLQRQIAKRFGL